MYLTENRSWHKAGSWKSLPALQNYSLRHLNDHDVSLPPSFTTYINMSKLRHTHIAKYTWLEDVAFLCIFAVDSLVIYRKWMKWVEVAPYSHNIEASSFSLTDRTSSEPVEDTDTTSFVAEFVSTFLYSFLQSCVCLTVIVLTCLLSSLLCTDFSLFFLRKQSLKSNLLRNVP